jgi:hypothetical protein
MGNHFVINELIAQRSLKDPVEDQHPAKFFGVHHRHVLKFRFAHIQSLFDPDSQGEIIGLVFGKP